MAMAFFIWLNLAFCTWPKCLFSPGVNSMMYKKYREAILRRPNAPKDRFSEILYEIKID